MVKRVKSSSKKSHRAFPVLLIAFLLVVGIALATPSLTGYVVSTNSPTIQIAITSGTQSHSDTLTNVAVNAYVDMSVSTSDRDISKIQWKQLAKETPNYAYFVSGQAITYYSGNDGINYPNMYRVKFTQPGNYVYSVNVTNRDTPNKRSTVKVFHIAIVSAQQTSNSAAPIVTTNLTSDSSVGAAASQIFVTNMSRVKLNASAVDANGISSYAWTKTSGPTDGYRVMVGNLNSYSATLQFTKVGVYIFKVNVTDNGSPKKSTVKEVTITVKNRPPTVAMEFTPGSVVSGSETDLAVTAFDADQDPLTFTWTKISGPTPIVVLNLPNPIRQVHEGTKSVYSLNLTQVGTYQFNVLIKDSANNQVTRGIFVIVTAKPASGAPAQPLAPPTLIVNVSANQTVTNGSIVTLVATGVTNRPGDLSYQWRELTGPPLVDSTVTAGSLASSTASLTLAQVGNYTFEVTTTLPAFGNQAALTTKNQTAIFVVNVTTPPVAPPGNLSTAGGNASVQQVCSSNSTCADNSYCVAPNTTAANCTALFCASGQVAQNHSCVAVNSSTSIQCTTNADCEDSKRCSSGSCVAVSCIAGSGQIVSNHQCTAPAVQSTGTGGSGTGSSSAGNLGTADASATTSSGGEVASSVGTASGAAQVGSPTPSSAVDALNQAVTTPSGDLNLPLVVALVIVLLVLIVGGYFMFLKKKPPTNSGGQLGEQADGQVDAQVAETGSTTESA